MAISIGVRRPERTARPAAQARRRRDLAPLLSLAAVALLVRLAPALYFNAEVADLTTYHRMADIVLRGHNIYFQHVLFPYTPLSMFLPAICDLLAQAFGLPFSLVVKAPAILADVAITGLLYVIARRISGRTGPAVALSLLYALNPVAILISAFHGNMTVVAVAFGLAAYALALAAREERQLWLGALLLGMAIGFRSYPVLWLPFFLIRLPLTWRQRVIFTALAALPSLATLLPFAVASWRDLLREAFTYSGFPDYGWVAIIRDAHLLLPKPAPNPELKARLQFSKKLFLAAYLLFVAMAAVRPRWFSLAGALTVSTLLFFAVYGGVSSQYLGWVLPFGLLSTLPFALAYTPVAATTLVSFYLVYYPSILWGTRHPLLTPAPRDGVVFYLVMLVQWELLGLIWLGWELTAPLRLPPLGRPARPYL